MQFFGAFERFLCEDDGAVTVDWVVLTASIVLLSVIALVGFEAAMSEVNVRTAASIAAAGAPST